MTGSEPKPEPGRCAVSYSTADAGAVARLVAERYGLSGPVTCGFLNRGFNDSFLITAPDGARFVLRLSGCRRRDRSQISAETAFLAHLASLDVPVAAAIATRDGTFQTEFDLPEGRRVAVLFRYLEGRQPDPASTADARLQGETLARIHTAGASFDDCSRTLGLDRLLHRNVAALLALDEVGQATRDCFARLAERLADEVSALEGLTQGHCHGDCHGWNARISTSDVGIEQAAFFDFDDGGYGYLAYDLAVFLWARVIRSPVELTAWHAFVAGYRASRSIAPGDERALPLFVAVRHLWLMGEYADRAAEWGSEAVSASWLDRQAEFLRRWEAERLSPALF